mgnify:CR=1 FL=1
MAVGAARSRPFDLILMDIQLPDIDGITALKRIREDAALDAAALMGQTPGDNDKPENIWPKHSDALAQVLNKAGVAAHQEAVAPPRQRTRKEEERDILDFARYGPAFEKLRPQLDEMTTSAGVAPLYVGEPYMHRPPSIVDWDAAQRQESEEDERGVKKGLSRFVVGKSGKPLAGGAKAAKREANLRQILDRDASKINQMALAYWNKNQDKIFGKNEPNPEKNIGTK